MNKANDDIKHFQSYNLQTISKFNKEHKDEDFEDKILFNLNIFED